MQDILPSRWYISSKSILVIPSTFIDGCSLLGYCAVLFESLTRTTVSHSRRLGISTITPVRTPDLSNSSTYGCWERMLVQLVCELVICRENYCTSFIIPLCVVTYSLRCWSQIFLVAKGFTSFLTWERIFGSGLNLEGHLAQLLMTQVYGLHNFNPTCVQWSTGVSLPFQIAM